MKLRLFITSVMLCICLTLFAQNVNLTPWPKTMTVKTGSWCIPGAINIATEGLSDDEKAEVDKFCKKMQSFVHSARIVTEGDADMTVRHSDTDLGDEGYKLDVTSSGVSIEASTPKGFFYAFQSFYMMLPSDKKAGSFTKRLDYLPYISINDSPAFKYRGFMLDVSRHFWTVDEIKKILRVMAAYKMNFFHWHLTDDQGWRVEIKKYPKLTTVAATRSNSFTTDMNYGQYWLNEEYGPYFYTQEEIKEVVKYAADLHITVIPEIEMPGHFAAAVTAYPEYSCNPNGSHGVWISGGISTDVLNVANEGAVQFAKDILSEIVPLFPYEVIHIGGDETPTTAWQNNAECQAVYKAEGMTNYSQLQSRFTKEIAAFLKTKGKRIAVWNEAITASGANTTLIQESEATIYCWNPCQSGALKAANLGLNAIITNYGTDGCYYINRKANTHDFGAGQGGDNLQKTYNYVPMPSSVATNLQPYFMGVQGSFWCEHVSDTAHLEHLALPRLMAIAEAGWTPQSRKNFTQFVNRIRQDTAMLHYMGLNYHPQFIDYEGAEPSEDDGDKVMPKTSNQTTAYYYKISSMGTTGSRAGRCIELIREGSSLITEYGGKGASVGKLWTNTAAAEGAENYDWQLWALESDPNGSGKYALVCKAVPAGSVNPQASANGTGGRWTYDNEKKNYNFTLADNGYGKTGNNYYYSIKSDAQTYYMNCAMQNPGYPVNLYNNPADGQGGYWEFVPTFEDSGVTLKDLLKEARTLLAKAKGYTDESDKAPGCFDSNKLQTLRDWVNNAAVTEDDLQKALTDVKESFVFPEKSQTYLIVNSTKEYAGEAICDVRSASYLNHSDEPFADNAWTIKSIGQFEGFTAVCYIQNPTTKRYVGKPADSATGKLGNLVGTSSGILKLEYLPAEGDFILSSSDMKYYPISARSTSNPGTVAAAAGALRPQGTGWTFVPAKVLTYDCKDTDGKSLGTFNYTCPLADLADPLLPTFEGYTVEKIDIATDGVTYTITYTNGAVGLKTIETSAAQRGTYDLQGRRLQRIPQKGVYIVNGVKVIRK